MEERSIHVPDIVSRYVLSHISCSRDQTQALNLIKTFNKALLQSDSVSLQFEIIYEAVQPSYWIDFYTEDREVSFACLRTTLDHRQIKDAELCPQDIYGPGYVRLHVHKLLQHSKRKRGQDEGGTPEWRLQRVQLDSIPEMGEWASTTDERIVREILEFTYGMHSVMPILRCSILHKPHAEHYVILCDNVPAIPYAFLKAMTAQFPTYLRQITGNVERHSLRYTVRLNESPLTSFSLVPTPTITTTLCSDTLSDPVSTKRARIQEIH